MIPRHCPLPSRMQAEALRGFFPAAPAPPIWMCDSVADARQNPPRDSFLTTAVGNQLLFGGDSLLSWIFTLIFFG